MGNTREAGERAEVKELTFQKRKTGPWKKIGRDGYLFWWTRGGQKKKTPQ